MFIAMPCGVCAEEPCAECVQKSPVRSVCRRVLCRVRAEERRAVCAEERCVEQLVCIPYKKRDGKRDPQWKTEEEQSNGNTESNLCHGN